MTSFDDIMRMAAGGQVAQAVQPAMPRAAAPQAQAQQPQATAQPGADFQAILTMAMGARQQAAPDLSNADMQSGAPFLDRLAGAFKFNDTGVENYLKSQYGEANVAKDPEGNLFFKPEGAAQFVRFDPQGLDVGDIAKGFPVGLGVLGGVGAAALTGGASLPATIATLAAGGALTDLGIQGIGAAIPGKEDATTGQRIGQAALAGGFEAVAPGVGKLLGATAKAAVNTGKKAAGAVANKITGATLPAAKEAVDLAGRTGIPFTSGQITNSKPRLMAEDALRNNIMSGGIVGDADAKRLEVYAKFADSAVKKLGSGDAEGAGKAAAAAYEANLKALGAHRSKQAAEMFGKVDQLTGNQKVFGAKNFLDTIDNLIQEQSAFGGSDSATRAVEWLQARKASLLNQASDAASNGDVKTTAREFQNTLRIYGEKAYDPRGLIARLEDPRLEKKIAGDLFDALKRDLDAAATSGGVSGDAAKALQEARRAYAANSQAISEVASNPLGSIGKPEDVVGMFFANTEADKLRGIMSYVDKTAPEVGNDIRSGVFQQILKKATAAGSDGGDDFLSPAKLSTIVGKNRKQFEIAFSGNKEALGAFNDLESASKVLARRAGNNSATAQRQQINGLLATASGALGYSAASDQNPAGELGLVGAAFFSSRALAKILTSPQATRGAATIMRAAANPESANSSTMRKIIRRSTAEIAKAIGRTQTNDRRESP